MNTEIRQIKARMIILGLTQHDIARRFKVNRSFVSLALRDQRTSKKAKKIKDYVLGLMYQKAA